MTPNDATEVVPFLTSAATVVYLQKWLKTWSYYQRFVVAFPGADKWAHWLIAGLASLIAALGIHYSYDWTAATGGNVTVHIPNLESLRHGGFDWFNVYILQHTIYNATHQSSISTVIQKATDKAEPNAFVIPPEVKS